MKKRFEMPVAVHLLLQKDGQVLMLLRANTGYEDGKYSVVAGHADGGEPVSLAMVREAKEEAGIDIDPADLRFACVVHRRSPDREGIDYFFACEKWQGEVRNAEPQKCGGLFFMKPDEIPEAQTVPYVYAVIRSVARGQNNLEFGW